MLYAEMAEKVLKKQGYWDDGWRVDNEAVLTCPHGHQIEYDGDCFEGCESPFKQMGVI